MPNYIDFAELKDRHPIDRVAEMLQLDTKQKNGQLRGKCPVCEGDSDRNLAITPAKGLYYCFAAAEGGDQLQLIAHVHGTSVKDAAQWLAGSDTDTPPKKSNKKQGNEARGGFQPLSYLEPDHAAVDAVGFPADVAEAVGIGYAKRGVMRGHVAVPVRLEDGTLIGYIGVEEAAMPPDWKL